MCCGRSLRLLFPLDRDFYPPSVRARESLSELVRAGARVTSPPRERLHLKLKPEKLDPPLIAGLQHKSPCERDYNVQTRFLHSYILTRIASGH